MKTYPKLAGMLPGIPAGQPSIPMDIGSAATCAPKPEGEVVGTGGTGTSSCDAVVATADPAKIRLQLSIILCRIVNQFSVNSP